MCWHVAAERWPDPLLKRHCQHKIWLVTSSSLLCLADTSGSVTQHSPAIILKQVVDHWSQPARCEASSRRVVYLRVTVRVQVCTTSQCLECSVCMLGSSCQKFWKAVWVWRRHSTPPAELLVPGGFLRFYGQRALARYSAHLGAVLSAACAA